MSEVSGLIASAMKMISGSRTPVAPFQGSPAPSSPTGQVSSEWGRDAR
jgi:hypothetical protein